MITFPNCKINLGLNVWGKRADGYHNLQTVFYPVALRDALEIITEPEAGKAASFTVSGINLHIPVTSNICYKAYHLIKNDFPKLPAVRLHLHKAIPSGAGLGGGSADAVAVLLLLNQKYSLGLSQNRLMEYALQLGSDCPFFLINKPCYATGRGEVLTPVALELSGYRIAIINPRIHINTGAAFAALSQLKAAPDIRDVIQQPVEKWRGLLINDFEPGIFKYYPEVKTIRDSLYKKGAAYAAMTGTGSTVFGFFKEAPDLDAVFPEQYFVKVI